MHRGEGRVGEGRGGGEDDGDRAHPPKWLQQRRRQQQLPDRTRIPPPPPRRRPALPPTPASPPPSLAHDWQLRPLPHCRCRCRCHCHCHCFDHLCGGAGGACRLSCCWVSCRHHRCPAASGLQHGKQKRYGLSGEGGREGGRARRVPPKLVFKISYHSGRVQDKVSYPRNRMWRLRLQAPGQQTPNPK